MMKKRNMSRVAIASLLGASLLMTACSSGKDDAVAPAAGNGEIALEFWSRS